MEILPFTVINRSWSQAVLMPLIDANRRKPNPKNRAEEATEMAVTAFVLEQPVFGQMRVSNELRKRGVFISPSGVRCVWLRRDLESMGSDSIDQGLKK